MNFILSRVSFYFIIMILSASSSFAEVRAYQQASDEDGFLVFEAEGYDDRVDANGQRWDVTAEPIGFIGEALEAGPDIGSNVTLSDITSDSPQLRFNVNFSHIGSHSIWVRGEATGHDNSVWVAVDDGEAVRVDIDTDAGWTRARSRLLLSRVMWKGFHRWSRDRYLSG